MTDTFPSCPTCGHLVFRHIGFGTEKVEKEIKKMFPGARILRADGSTMRTKKDRQKFFESTSLGNVDILIGTQMILKRHTLPKLSFIGMIDADSLLSFPDFRADEKLFHVLTRFVEIQGHSIHSCANPRIIVQTFHPENSFFQKISEKKSDIFLQYLLDEREDLFYPPFSRLITLIFQDKNETIVLSHLNSIEEKIRILLKDTDIPYRMRTVSQAKQQKKKCMFVAKIILRIPRQKIPEQLSSFFKKQSSLFTLDIDSLSFF